MFFFVFFFISGESHEPSEGTQFLWMLFFLFPAGLIFCCLRYLCCCKTSETDSQASPVEPDQTHPPQYNASALNTNFSSQAQYTNSGFSSGQLNHSQMGSASAPDPPASFSYSSSSPAISSAGGFIQPPSYEEAVRQPSGHQYGRGCYFYFYLFQFQLYYRIAELSTFSLNNTDNHIAP